MKVAYTGTSNFQEFDKHDFAKAGIEDGPKLRFAQGVPLEVDDAVGQALVSKDGIFGAHSFVDVSDAGEGAETEEEAQLAEEKAAEKLVKKTAKKAAQEPKVPNLGNPAPVGGSTGGAATAGTGTTGSTAAASTRGTAR